MLMNFSLSLFLFIYTHLQSNKIRENIFRYALINLIKKGRTREMVRKQRGRKNERNQPLFQLRLPRFSRFILHRSPRIYLVHRILRLLPSPFHLPPPPPPPRRKERNDGKRERVFSRLTWSLANFPCFLPSFSRLLWPRLTISHAMRYT